MPTLKEKRLLNDAVTGETKRCLAVVNREFKKAFDDGDEDQMKLYERIITEIIKKTPYLEFHPELLKRLPK